MSDLAAQYLAAFGDWSLDVEECPGERLPWKATVTSPSILGQRTATTHRAASKAAALQSVLDDLRSPRIVVFNENSRPE